MVFVGASVRGLSMGIVATTMLATVVLILGFGVIEVWPLFLVGALAAALFLLIAPSHRLTEAMGAAVAGVGSVVVGMALELGSLAYLGGVASVISVAWLYAGQPLPTLRWAWSRWVASLLLVLGFVILPLILDGGTLGHDESAYGVRSKSWLYGTPDSGWSLHRGIAMSYYGYLALSWGGAEGALRSIGLFGVLALAVGVWSLANRLAGRRVALISAVAAVAGPAVLRRSTEHLSDLPSAALLVFCMVVVWRELGERESASYRLLWVLPLAWTAFYLRYQSALTLSLIGLVVVLLWWSKLARRPGPVVLTIAIGILGLIPHFLYAMEVTGTPWGILLQTGGGAGRAYLGEGLVDYARDLAWPLAGFVGPIAAVAALAGTIAYRSAPAIKERFQFLMVPAVLQVVALGVISHGEPRFVFFPLALVVIAAAIALDRWVTEGEEVWRTAFAGAALMLLLGSFALATVAARNSVQNRAASFLSIEVAAELIRSESGEETCGVLTTFAPQITYYSECTTVVFSGGREPEELLTSLPGEHRYMVLLEGGQRQPAGDDLETLIDLTQGSPTVVDGELDVEVFRFD